mgnify:CR=1 FL=1
MNNYGQTALHYAANYGKIEIVKELLKQGANKAMEDRDSKTAYDRALNQEIKALLR